MAKTGMAWLAINIGNNQRFTGLNSSICRAKNSPMLSPSNRPKTMSWAVTQEWRISTSWRTNKRSNTDSGVGKINEGKAKA